MILHMDHWTESFFCLGSAKTLRAGFSGSTFRHRLVPLDSGIQFRDRRMPKMSKFVAAEVSKLHESPSTGSGHWLFR